MVGANEICRMDAVNLVRGDPSKGAIADRGD
jgi:hypothetical protein